MTVSDARPRRTIAERANLAIETFTPAGRPLPSNQAIADAMNRKAQQMYDSGELDEPISVSHQWVWQLRKGERNGRPSDVLVKPLIVFAKTLGVSIEYFVGDDDTAGPIEQQLLRLQALKSSEAMMAVAYRMQNLPEDRRKLVLDALESAENPHRPPV